MVDVPVELGGTATVMRMDIEADLADGTHYGTDVGTFIRQFASAASEAIQANGEVS
jgi:hypothetical protein